MNREKAIDVATEAARAAGASLEDYLLPPTCRMVDDEWLVLFQEKTMTVGGHFMAVVHVRSGDVQLVAGA